MTNVTAAPNAGAVVGYDSGGRGIMCPLCRKRPLAKKTYGHDVCKKCFYRFANARQIAYLIDAILVTVINLSLGRLIDYFLVAGGATAAVAMIVSYAYSFTAISLFICKDGFSGYSPGKWLMGVQVLDDQTMKPIGFFPSFKRNLFILIGVVPFGIFVSSILMLVVAYQDPKGYRFGDGFAKTRVIWKKFAHLPVFGGNALVCESCGYELKGNLSGTCPECGTLVSERNRALLEVPAAAPSVPA
jgi:uncharacterized RDD family membrane protein YckC